MSILIAANCFSLRSTSSRDLLYLDSWSTSAWGWRRGGTCQWPWHNYMDTYIWIVLPPPHCSSRTGSTRKWSLTTNSATILEQMSALDWIGAVIKNDHGNVSRSRKTKKCSTVGERKKTANILFCSTGVSGGESSLSKIPLSSVMSGPEYTLLSSQMDSILSTDRTTLASPSCLSDRLK